MKETVHYGMTQDEARARYASTGNFEGPLPICGNGSFHVKTSRDRAEVTCPACLSKLPR